MQGSRSSIFIKTLKHRITLFLLFLLSGAHSFASFIFSFGFNVIITLQFLIEVSSSCALVSISIGFAGSSVLSWPPLPLFMLTHVKFTYTRIYVVVTQYRPITSRSSIAAQWFRVRHIQIDVLGKRQWASQKRAKISNLNYVLALFEFNYCLIDKK